MRVNHPNLSHIHYDVPELDVDRWVRSGWVVDELLEDLSSDTEQAWKDANASFKKEMTSTPLEGGNDGN